MSKLYNFPRVNNAIISATGMSSIPASQAEQGFRIRLPNYSFRASLQGLYHKKKTPFHGPRKTYAYNRTLLLNRHSTNQYILHKNYNQQSATWTSRYQVGRSTIIG